MVASTFNATSNGQESEKRRKQTVERAKATHLSRQLQLRLQYARLKVDHGWQKQNLNEVENLYFHHSHQRGPKPYPSPPVVTATPSTSYTSAPANPPQSSLSFKLGSSSFSRPQTSENLGAKTPWPERTPPNTSNSPLASTFDRTSPERSDPGPPIDSTGMRSLIQLEADEETKRSATPPSITPHIPSPGPSQSNTSANFTPTTTIFRSDTMPAPYVPAPYTPYTPAPAWNTTSRPLPSSSNHYPNAMHRQPMAPSSQPTTTSADNSFNFPTASLTYDSFWSSHSSSAASRSFQGSSSNMMATSGYRAGPSGVADMAPTYQAAAARGERQPPVARVTAGREG